MTVYARGQGLRGRKGTDRFLSCDYRSDRVSDRGCFSQGFTPHPPSPPGGEGGCSSYQRLSKFADPFCGPILKPGLRG